MENLLKESSEEEGSEAGVEDEAGEEPRDVR